MMEMLPALSLQEAAGVVEIALQIIWNIAWDHFHLHHVPLAQSKDNQ